MVGRYTLGGVYPGVREIYPRWCIPGCERSLCADRPAPKPALYPFHCWPGIPPPCYSLPFPFHCWPVIPPLCVPFPFHCWPVLQPLAEGGECQERHLPGYAGRREYPPWDTHQVHPSCRIPVYTPPCRVHARYGTTTRTNVALSTRAE